MNALDRAKAERAAARAAFLDDPTSEKQKRVTTAAAAVAKAEREAVVLVTEERARLQAEYDARTAVDRECVARLESGCAKLVAKEHEASDEINEINRLCTARQLAFYRTKQLALALGVPDPPRQPPSALVVSDYLQSEITRAQQAEGRNGNDSRQVSVWLQPAARAHAVRSRIA